MRVRQGPIVWRALAWLCLTLASFGGAVSCLPADTRTPPGSLFLALVSENEPSVTTADGWSISVDRFLLGAGHVELGRCCTGYSDAEYNRLLDALLPTAQKVGIVYGLGQCGFSFRIASSSSDQLLLGEGVTEADKELMGTWDDPGPHRLPTSNAVYFAASATRGGETKHVHWLISMSTSYFDCARRTETGATQPMRLESNENVSLHVGIRGVELFGNDESMTAELRFDPFAYADDEFGDGDGEVTLQEIGRVELNRLRAFGPYSASNTATSVRSLGDYLYYVLLPKIARFRENVTCETRPGFGGFERPPCRMGQ